METFLILLSLLVLFIVSTFNVTSVTFLFTLLVFFSYVVPYFTLWPTFMSLGLVNQDYLYGFFVLIFLCLIGFIIGDKAVPTVREHLMPVQNTLINYERFELYSIITGCIGLAGYGYFILASGASYFMGHLSGDFSVGGYVYELRYFIFASVLLLYNLYLTKNLSKKGFLFLLFICAFLTWDAYIQQQRGSWIRLGVIFMFSYLFHKEGSNPLSITKIFVKYKRILIGGALLAFLLVITVQIRKFYSANSSFTDQVSNTLEVINDNPDLLVAGSGIDEGNEFVTAYNGYQAAEISGVYDYGQKWLYPFMNFIPRNLWTDKPRWETYSINIFTYIDRYSKIRHAPGSAETGIVDAFYRFSWLTPFFFFLLGFYTKKLQNRSAYNTNTRLWYICLYIGCFYFFTQNMMPMVIFTLYMYIPIWVVTKTCVRRNRAAFYSQIVSIA